jgi:hypothetical protein
VQDWEYPGSERGGIEDDGKNFLAFLKELKAASNIIVSFTAPASYWFVNSLPCFVVHNEHQRSCRYLQQFPIKDMQDYADWINLMTYVHTQQGPCSPRCCMLIATTGHPRQLGHQIQYRCPPAHRYP